MKRREPMCDETRRRAEETWREIKGIGWAEAKETPGIWTKANAEEGVILQISSAIAKAVRAEKDRARRRSRS